MKGLETHNRITAPKAGIALLFHFEHHWRGAGEPEFRRRDHTPMPKTITDAEFKGVIALTAPERYSYFVRQVADFQEVWGLRTPGGWVSMGDDSSRNAIPVWPHSRYAEAFIEGEWSAAVATPIELEVWMSRWLPGMSKDGVHVAVFPVAEAKQRGVVVSPERLHEDLTQELERYE